MQLGADIAAIVTGGASGLGEASARRLAKQGVKVGILDMNAERGSKVAAEIGGVFAACDVASEASVAGALAAVRARHGAERVLVNCAGIGPAKRTIARNRETNKIVPHELKFFARVIEINLIGTFHMIAQSAAAMADLPPVTPDGGRGAIICTASVAAEDGQIGQAAYAASKGGIVGMTLPVARDLSSFGIRVVTIMPGLFHTPMFDTIPDDVRKTLEASIPFPKRLGKPDEYAQLVQFICENDMLNGTAIRLDGSVRMAPK